MIIVAVATAGSDILEAAISHCRCEDIWIPIPAASGDCHADKAISRRACMNYIPRGKGKAARNARPCSSLRTSGTKQPT